MADGLRGLGLSPLGPAPTAGTHTTPPPKKFPGEVRGYQEPSGAKQTNRTGHPTGTASTSTTRGQAARMASMATKGAACLRRVSVDKT